MDDTDLVGVLAEWCAIPSTVGDSAGAAEMRAAVAARLAATGALIRDHPLADGTHALVGRMRPEHTLQLLVVAHTDTPYGADHPVRRATREGDRLVGPGAAEMKGGIVVALAALAALETTADSGGLGWTLAVIPDGVHGAPQSGMLVRELARGAAVVAVMGRAAPGGEPVRSRMGVVRLRLVVRGRAAHAARNPGEGRNAIVALADVVGAVAGLDDPQRGVMVNVGRIGGGGTPERVPEFAVAELEVRVRKAAQLAEIPERIEQLGTGVARRRDVDVRVEVAHATPPLPEQAGRDTLIAALREAGADLGVALGPGAESAEGSLAALLADEGPVVLDGMGVVGGGVETAAEYCVAASLGERSRLLTALMRRLARAEIWLPEWGERTG